MQFDPNNNVVRLCLQGMIMEEKGEPEEARRIFLQAWDEATNDFEKFTAAFYVARQQRQNPDKLKWLETTLQYALTLNDDDGKGAIPSRKANIAERKEIMGDIDRGKKRRDIATR